MINASKFVKSHIPLCICTLGIAVFGYLGYLAVRWIINKCHKTEKIDLVAQKNISNHSASHFPKPLINRVSNLEIGSDKITMGQGEYVVFHKLPNGEKKQLSPETFEQIYKILIQYSPAVLINSGSEKASAECANRYELIKAKLKEIDPTLEAMFVPRTLYELIFIRKCIKEDLKHKNICPQVAPILHNVTLEYFDGDQEKYQKFLQENAVERAKRKCWHLCYFEDAGDNEHAGVKDVAYRLNKVMIKAFDPSNEGFTHQEFSTFAEKEIEFLKSHHRDEKAQEISNCNTPGPTTNFGLESSRGSIKSMGIRNETDAQIIRDAIALDCSKVAQKSFFLYRGADFQKDSTSCSCWSDKNSTYFWSNKNTPYSLSYGTSLFAGCLYDGGATAFHYMRNGQNDAYAVPVPFDQLNNSPFYIPPSNIVVQLFGDGEIFHSRTKAWKGYDLRKIKGMNLGANGCQRDHLMSNLTKDELAIQFQRYKNKAIQLK